MSPIHPSVDDSTLYHSICVLHPCTSSPHHVVVQCHIWLVTFPSSPTEEKTTKAQLLHHLTLSYLFQMTVFQWYTVMFSSSRSCFLFVFLSYTLSRIYYIPFLLRIFSQKLLVLQLLYIPHFNTSTVYVHSSKKLASSLPSCCWDTCDIYSMCDITVELVYVSYNCVFICIYWREIRAPVHTHLALIRLWSRRCDRIECFWKCSREIHKP